MTGDGILKNLTQDDKGQMPDTSPFLTLPLELRLMIYKLVLISTKPISWRGGYAPANPCTSWPPMPLFCNTQLLNTSPACNIMALCLTNPQIYVESAPIFYRKNTFQSPACTMRMPQAFLNQTFARNLEHLELGINRFRIQEENIAGVDTAMALRINEVIRLCPALKTCTIYIPVIYVLPMRPRTLRTRLFEVVNIMRHDIKTNFLPCVALLSLLQVIYGIPFAFYAYPGYDSKLTIFIFYESFVLFEFAIFYLRYRRYKTR